MRRALFGVGFLAVASLLLYIAWRCNAFSNAPLKWKVAVDDYETVCHVAQDSIYCAANVSATWGLN
jgi:hypothetical protein